MNTKKVWFVTRVSKGLGLSLVKKLLSEDYLVAATSRNSNDLNDEIASNANFLALEVDIVNENSVSSAITKTLERFVQAGYTIDIATPAGQKPTADERSLDPKIALDAPKYVQYLKALSKNLDHPIVLSKVNMANYKTVIIPGGHAPVVDLYKDKDMGHFTH